MDRRVGCYVRNTSCGVSRAGQVMAAPRCAGARRGVDGALGLGAHDGAGRVRGRRRRRGCPDEPAAAGAFNPATDTGSLYSISRIVRANSAWQAGCTRQGGGRRPDRQRRVPVPGLTSGNVVNGPDLSFDSQKPNLANLDGYGHGTHMASIIVGATSLDRPATRPPRRRSPGSPPTLVSVKAGASDGAVDVTQVIAGINWVVQHAHDAGYNIRVINLSYGTRLGAVVAVDPLAYAVEAAWKAGIVVVASGGNDGTPATVADPGDRPVRSPRRRRRPARDPRHERRHRPGLHEPRHTTTRHVDLIAPGAYVVGLRVPGSVRRHAIPRRRASATGSSAAAAPSQATAVVAGAAARLLSEAPDGDRRPGQEGLEDVSAGPSPAPPNITGAAESGRQRGAERGGLGRHRQTGAVYVGTGSLEGSRGRHPLAAWTASRLPARRT